MFISIAATLLDDYLLLGVKRSGNCVLFLFFILRPVTQKFGYSNLWGDEKRHGEATENLIIKTNPSVVRKHMSVTVDCFQRKYFCFLYPVLPRKKVTFISIFRMRNMLLSKILRVKFHSIKLKFHSSLNQKLTMLIRVKSTRMFE